MRNFLILLVMAIFIIGCDSMPSIDGDWHKLDDSPNNLNNSNNGLDIVSWVIDNIEYECYANGFNTARETYKKRSGNCANMALLEIALWYKITGKKGSLIYCLHKNGLHYCAKIDGKIWETNIEEIYDVIEFDNIAEFIYYRQ